VRRSRAPTRAGGTLKRRGLVSRVLTRDQAAVYAGDESCRELIPARGRLCFPDVPPSGEGHPGGVGE
jgi:hypothetical protein